MGALTFKPFSFQVRPWELTAVTGVNYLDGGLLTVYHRGGRVVKLAVPDGWLLDRTRFSYDGFRRQRLTSPYWNGRACSWLTALTAWCSWVALSASFVFRVDPGGLPFWLVRWYSLWSQRGGRVVTVGHDVSAPAAIYHGGYGLVGAVTARLVLPGCIPWEEDATLGLPTGGATTAELTAAVAQVFTFTTVPAAVTRLAAGWSHLGRQPQWAVLQVSPLQRLLLEW